MKEYKCERRFDKRESKAARELREIEERKMREKDNPPPFPVSQMHKYVFYGGRPIRRNSF